MANVTDFPAVGKVAAATEDAVTFLPHGTNYELELAVSGGYTGPINTRVNAIIHARAQKVFTTQAGGNFLNPIFGRLKVVQGRILYLDEKQMVVRAGVPVVVDLPESDKAIEMERGPLQVGTIVNALVAPGATLELLAPAIA